MESGSKNFKMENEFQMAPYKDYFRLGENYSAWAVIFEIKK
jgi:hypothetical protein